MARRRRPLRAVSLVFGGFVTLVLLSQLSAHYFATAIPTSLVAKNEAVLASIRATSTDMAIASAALGVVFAVAVLIITRQLVAADVDIYRAAGLPEASTFLRVLRSHSVVPLAWVLVAAAVTSLVDVEFGLSALPPIGLAVLFAAILVGWLAFLTSVSFSHKSFAPGAERSG
jgi:hypothetical protein